MRPSFAAAALAASLLLAACGGASKPATTSTGATNTLGPGGSGVITVTLPDSKPPATAQVRRAAKRTAAEAGYRADVHLRLALARFHGGALTATGSGHFDSASDTGTVNVTLDLPGLLGVAGALPSQLVAVGREVYIRVPSDLESVDPSLHPWLEASLADLDLTTLNPAVILGQIARDATRKIPDQRATVTIDSTTGLIRTILLTYYVPGSKAHITVRLKLTAFGAEPVSAAPPAAKVGRLTSALKTLGL